MIDDAFTHLAGTVSRQRIWQLRQRAKGLCMKCGHPLNGLKNYCRKHTDENNRRQQKKYVPACSLTAGKKA